MRERSRRIRLLLGLGLILALAGGIQWRRTLPADPFADPSADPERATLQPAFITPFEPAPHAPSQLALAPPDAATVAGQTSHPDAAAIGALSPEREIQVVGQLFSHFRERFGAFPAGQENRHFIHALQGRNPKAVAIFPLDHPRLNAAGDLLDPWDNPYFFHPVSRHRLEIRSAGPDGELFTDDDLVYPRHPKPRE
ncbi:MAG: hypothetical protein JJT96_16235 [Opitutales bacterium]|nr:hypothetical protein [Opitutales bacterium]